MIGGEHGLADDIVDDLIRGGFLKARGPKRRAIIRRVDKIIRGWD